jgi:hypothetical protein
LVVFAIVEYVPSVSASLEYDPNAVRTRGLALVCELGI